MITHFFKKNKSKREMLEEFKSKFFLSPYHYWISEEQSLCNIFDGFFNMLHKSTLEHLLYKKEIILVRANGKYSCALSSIPNANITIIFPDLLDLLKSRHFKVGYAIMAHELGHIICDHSLKKVDPMVAQFEADEFAFNLGLGQEMIMALESFGENTECAMRIRYIKNLYEGFKHAAHKEHLNKIDT